MTADLSSLGPIMKPLLKHAAKFAEKSKGKKATAAMKIKAKVSIKGGKGRTDSTDKN